MDSKAFPLSLQEHMLAANPDFDLADCLQAEALTNSALWPYYSNLFSLSLPPLPEPTPPPLPEIGLVSLLLILTSDNLEQYNAVVQHLSSPTKVLPLLTHGLLLPRQKLLTPSTKAADRKATKKAASHANRKAKQEKARFGHYMVHNKVIRDHVNLLDPVHCDIAIENAPVQSTRFVAGDDGTGCQKVYRLEEVVGEKSRFKLRLKG